MVYEGIRSHRVQWVTLNAALFKTGALLSFTKKHTVLGRQTRNPFKSSWVSRCDESNVTRTHECRTPQRRTTKEHGPRTWGCGMAVFCVNLDSTCHSKMCVADMKWDANVKRFFPDYFWGRSLPLNLWKHYSHLVSRTCNVPSYLC